MNGTPHHGLSTLLAVTGIFLPGMLLVLAALPHWQAMRVHPSTAAVLSGVNAAVVGLLASALYSPVWTSAVNPASISPLPQSASCYCAAGKCPHSPSSYFPLWPG